MSCFACCWAVVALLLRATTAVPIAGDDFLALNRSLAVLGCFEAGAACELKALTPTTPCAEQVPSGVLPALLCDATGRVVFLQLNNDSLRGTFSSQLALLTALKHMCVRFAGVFSRFLSFSLARFSCFLCCLTD